MRCYPFMKIAQQFEQWAALLLVLLSRWTLLNWEIPAKDKMNTAYGYLILILVTWFSGMATSTQIKPLIPIRIAESDFVPEKTYNTKSLVQ